MFAFLLPLLVAQYSVVYSIPNGESPSFVFPNPDKQKWCTTKRSATLTPTTRDPYVRHCALCCNFIVRHFMLEAQALQRQCPLRELFLS